jgi:calcium-binding protein CML
MGCFKSKKNANIGEEVKQVYEYQTQLITDENKLYKEIDQLFHEFDKDNDLSLDKEEFLNSLNELKRRYKTNIPVHERIQSFTEQLDLVKGKRFTKEEYRITLSSVVLDDFTVNELIDLFKTFDKKKDGRICAQELIHTFKKLGLNITKDIANELIEEASFGDSGKIDFEEFARALLAK